MLCRPARSVSYEEAKSHLSAPARPSKQNLPVPRSRFRDVFYSTVASAAIFFRRNTSKVKDRLSKTFVAQSSCLFRKDWVWIQEGTGRLERQELPRRKKKEEKSRSRLGGEGDKDEAGEAIQQHTSISERERRRKMSQGPSQPSPPSSSSGPPPTNNSGAGQNRTRTAEPSAGSQTQTEAVPTAAAAAATPILRLRGEHTARPGPRVQWDESVVDNEGMGKKSSKGWLGLGFTVSFAPSFFFFGDDPLPTALVGN